MKGLGVGAAVLGVPALLLGLFFVAIFGSNNCMPSFAPGGSSAAGLPANVAGYSGDQLQNAAVIVNTVSQRKLSSQAQVVTIAAAMGESSLKNIDYGDDAHNPDGTLNCSLGLFQQQWCLGWGTRAQVMDPVYATNAFVDSLVKVPGWENMPVSIAINRVQGNSDPYHYAKFEAPAREVVQALTGVSMPTEPTQCTSAGGNFTPANGKEPGPWGGYQNGEIPTSALTQIPWDSRQFLRSDAAASLIAMNAAFRSSFGYDLPLNDAYRTLQQQRIDKATYGDGAAEPGTSNHGWAMAVDIGDQSHYVIGYNSEIYAWLKANAVRFGWAHPGWAEPDGQGPHEAWHWEYYGLI